MKYEKLTWVPAQDRQVIKKKGTTTSYWLVEQTLARFP